MTNLDCSACDQLDITLDIDLAYLDLDERGLNATQIPTDPDSIVELDELETTKNIRRSRRKRIRPVDCQNRRSTTKPKKIIDGNYKETINYYLDKRIKRLPSNLETIFEEPKSDVLMSNRKLKRFIQFPELGFVIKDKLKIKKRVMKAKKLHPIKHLKKRLSMDLLMKKLVRVEQVD